MAETQPTCSRLRQLLAGGAAACALFAGAPAARAEPADVRRDPVVEAVAEVMPCVVNVATERRVEARDPFQEFFLRFYGPQYSSSLGSGVIISEDGDLLTNLHVVNRATRIQVKLSDEAGGAVYDVEPVFAQINIDIALLKIIPKKKGEKFKAVKFARDDDLLLGETVIALGNPFGLGESVSRGILSSKRRAVARENEPLGMANWLQTDALINPGNSGGPLINVRGELIGINAAILQEAQSIGFAIPIKEVRAALNDILAPETASRWFGARVSQEGPLAVTSVDARSPAGKAGLKTGDTILEVNGKKPADFMEFNRWLREGPGLDFTLAYRREGAPGEARVHLLPFREFFKQRLGVEIQELTPALVAQLGLGRLGGTGSGLLISGVEKGSPADRASLREYFVIAGVEGRRVHNAFDAFQFLAGVEKGEAVRVSLLVPRTKGDLILGYQRGEAALKLR